MRLPLRSMLLCALFAALAGVCSQLSIPLPMVPINLALFSVHLCGYLLGWRLGGLAMGVYLLLGLLGVPVFAGFGAGPGTLFGRTGGYILGYVLAAMVTGFLARQRPGFFPRCLAMGLGTVVCYIFGTIWFMAITGMGLWESLGYCVLPFLPGDVVKILLAAWLGGRLQPHVERMLGNGNQGTNPAAAGTKQG